MVATGALSVLSAIWFAANLYRSRWWAGLGWWPGPIALGLASVALLGLGRSPELVPAARRFWTQIGVATVMITVGTGTQSFVITTGVDPSVVPKDASLSTLGFFLVGVLIALWALLRLPIGARSPAQRLHLILDGVTVMAGATLFSWYFAFAPLASAGGGKTSVLGLLVVAGFTQVALAAVVKVLLAGTGPVDVGALRVMSMSLIVGALSPGLTPLLADRPHVAPSTLITAPIAFFVACAVVRQHHAARVRGASAGSSRVSRRPYSLLPYLALAATDALLLSATVRHVDRRTPIVVAGAILVTSLVAVRQLAAFVDNTRLLRSLGEHKDQLHHQASHDSLTGLANRALFGERLRAALARSDGVAVVLIDLDDFKIVNDTLGHTVGDGLLVAVAGRLTACVRPVDTVARLGGDEFGILLIRADPATPATPLEVTELIQASLTRPFAASGHSLMVQASIGVAESGPGDDLERLLRNADIAMYSAKEHGKGRHARYSPAMHAQLLEQAQIGAQLHSALDCDELDLLYQPIVALPSGRLYGVEALVRWRHPASGLLPPARFIGVAERTGLIVPLGRWVLDRACRQLVAWRVAHPGALLTTMSVNVSARQLQEPTFAAEIAAALAEFGLEPVHLIVEVTETAVLKGGQVLRTLGELRGMGVNLALDDFGTGHSSLSLLRTCPVDILKVDKSFIDEISETTQRPPVATAIIQMAQALGLATVAEGIESDVQADQLWRLGYQLGQGYHFGRPLPADAIADLLAIAGTGVTAGPADVGAIGAGGQSTTQRGTDR
jgi:diguanylate cyclase (GGDEF)-like protein